MGRVSRYKKVKSCYNGSFGEWGTEEAVKKKKRSRTAQRLKPNRKHDDRNLAPEEAEDEFDLKTFEVKSIRKLENPLSSPKYEEERGKKNEGSVAIRNDVAFEHPDDEQLFRQISKQMKQDEKKKWKQDMARKRGESNRAFRRRLHRETSSFIQHGKASVRSEEKKEKKKQYLTEKKQKKKRKHSGSAPSIGTIDSNPTGMDDEQANPEPFVFGDCVERPPVFSHLPRGASQKIRTRAQGPDSIETLREEVQKQYSLLRQRRREHV